MARFVSSTGSVDVVDLKMGFKLEEIHIFVKFFLQYFRNLLISLANITIGDGSTDFVVVLFVI